MVFLSTTDDFIMSLFGKTGDGEPRQKIGFDEYAISPQRNFLSFSGFFLSVDGIYYNIMLT